MATLIEQTATGSVTNDDQKFLTFHLAKEDFGVPILSVREIIGVMNITAVPQMPSYMKGVINLRGKVIPVIDLRLRFGLPEKEYTEETCIIVIDIGREIGMVVDTVSEVLPIDNEQIDPPPTVGDSMDVSFVSGMGKIDDSVKILLNIEQVLAEETLPVG